ncbi:hypothetical protein GOV04_00175 [Candidatus Woesearchaeota archaeon]|nr:hypothetical protein [Candidatus Woesearchaeota archaeon]
MKRVVTIILVLFLFGCSQQIAQEPEVIEEPTVNPVIEDDVTVIENIIEPEIIEEVLVVQPSKKIINEQPLSLRSSQKLEIIDTHYVLDNDLIIDDNAQLIIKNSIFEHRQSYARQHSLKASESAQVIIENSKILTNCKGSLNWEFFDDSKLIAKNVIMPSCNTWNFFTNTASANIEGWDFFGATFCESSSATINNSNDMELELCYPHGTTLDISLPTNITSFVFNNVKARGVESNIAITESTVDGWGVTVGPGDDITIRDTESVTISIIVGAPLEKETVLLTDLNQKLYTDKTYNMVYSKLRLVNTGVYGWEPNVFGNENTLIITNSNFTGPTINSGNSKQIIENSYMQTVQTYEEVRIVVQDSVIYGDVISHDKSAVALYNTQVLGQLYEEDSSRIIVE